MAKFQPNQQIVERHYGVGTIIHRVLFRYYLATFVKDCPHFVKEENIHKYNNTTGEIS